MNLICLSKNVPLSEEENCVPESASKRIRGNMEIRTARMIFPSLSLRVVLDIVEEK